MSTKLEYRVEDNNIVWYAKTIADDGRIYHSKISSSSLAEAKEQAQNLLKDINVVEKTLIYPVNGYEISVSDMQKMIPTMRNYLKKHGIDV